jgi:hypothetical protein
VSQNEDVSRGVKIYDYVLAAIAFLEGIFQVIKAATGNLYGLFSHSLLALDYCNTKKYGELYVLSCCSVLFF